MIEERERGAFETVDVNLEALELVAGGGGALTLAGGRSGEGGDTSYTGGMMGGGGRADGSGMMGGGG